MLEHLGKAVVANPAPNVWLDKTLCVEEGLHSTSIESESVLRVITSSSHNKSGEDMRQMT